MSAPATAAELLAHASSLDLDGILGIEAAILRANFGLFCERVLEPLGQRPAAHHWLLISELQNVANRQTKRLMVTMPPGSAKSTYGSVLFPAWFLARKPRLAVIGAANTATLAEQFSKRVQRVAREHGDLLDYALTTESAELWQTTNGGQYRAAGVGGVVTGFRADLALIDDPLRGREDADSERIREKTWAWWVSDLQTRLKPGAPVVLITTRWHEDDLAGRLLATEPDAWRLVSLPAQAVDGDPLGRQPGEWLWGDDEYGYANTLRERRDELIRAGASREWSALYQQDPRPAEGLLFRVAAIPEPLPAAPVGRAARAWDLAATDDGGDYTAGVKLIRTGEGRFVVADVVRERGGPDEVERLIVSTARVDGTGCIISLPQDPGQAGKSQVLYYTRKLAGYRVQSSPETGDKATRAGPFAAQLNVGNVSLVQSAWNRSFTEELRGFPAGTHDDQVDAASRAFAALIARPNMKVTPEALAALARVGR